MDFKIFIYCVIITFLLFILLYFYVCIDDLIIKIKVNKVTRMDKDVYYELVLKKILKIFNIKKIENNIIKFNNGFLLNVEDVIYENYIRNKPVNDAVLELENIIIKKWAEKLKK